MKNNQRIECAGPRGHDVYCHRPDWEWRYIDDDSIVWPIGQESPPGRRCVDCGAEPTPKAHDFCISDIPGAISACCGHGRGGAFVALPGPRVGEGSGMAVEIWLLENEGRLNQILRSGATLYPSEFDEQVADLADLAHLDSEQAISALRWGWSRRPRQLPRTEKLLRRAGSRVEEVTAAAFECGHLIDRLNQLMKLPGVGLASAGILLSVRDPSIPIESTYSRRGLRVLGWAGYRQPASHWHQGGWKHGYPRRFWWLQFQDAVRLLCAASDVRRRDIDRALYVFGRLHPTSV